MSARGQNIDSLAVCTTLDPKISRVTLTTDGQARAIEQIIKQLGKQIRVLEVINMNQLAHIEREMALINVFAPPGPARQKVFQLASAFRAEVIDSSDDGFILEARGEAGKLTEFIRLLEPFGVRDMVRTGAIAMVNLAGVAASRAEMEGI
jgi:acetolactate synthase-1/3 small subunit